MVKRCCEEKSIRIKNGFTLVELLIAIAILAVITVPMLTAFISSANANSRARRKMEATTAAQNVMENIKAVGVQSYLDSLKIGPDASNHYTYAAPDSNGIYNLDNSDETASGVLVPQQIINGKTFRFKVELDPTTESGQVNTYNSESLANIPEMNTLADAFFSESEAADKKVIEEYMASESISLAGYKSESAIKSALQREMDIVITNTDPEHNGTTKVNVKCIYRLDSNESTKKEVTYLLYDNSDIQDGKLNAVYFFYTPLYYLKTAGTSVKDTIKILNNTSSTKSFDAKVYLIKQHSSNLAIENTNELNYSVDLSVEEMDPDYTINWPPQNGYRAKTTVLTNIGFDINDTATQRSTQWANVNYKCSGNSTVTSEDAEKYLGITTIDNSMTSTRLYSVKIEVYVEGSDDSLYTLKGTAES